MEWNGVELSWVVLKCGHGLHIKHHLCSIVAIILDDFDLNSKSKSLSSNKAKFRAFVFSCFWPIYIVYVHDSWINHEAQLVWFAIHYWLFDESNEKKKALAFLTTKWIAGGEISPLPPFQSDNFFGWVYSLCGPMSPPPLTVRIEIQNILTKNWTTPP